MKKLLAPDGGDVHGSSSIKKTSLSGSKALKSNTLSSSVPMENRGQWLSAALETLKKERQSQLQSSIDEIQPELSVEPEEGEDYSQEWIRSPEPALKLPTTQFHNKTIKFQPYKTSRPELLVRLERLVYDQLRELPAREAQKREGTESPELLEVKAKHASPKSHKQKLSTTSPRPTKVPLNESIAIPIQDATDDQEESSRPLSYYAHRKQVYGEVLQGYVAESTIYHSVLSEAHYAYESYIQQLEMRVEELGTKAMQVNWREEQMEKQLADAQLAHQQKVDSLQEHMRQLELKAIAAEKERAKMEVELGRQKDAVVQGRKQFDEIKQTCVTLTSSLARMDEEHRQFHQSETARLQEVNHLRSSEQKLNEEIERLQQVVQGMEQTQSSMVNQDVVINLEMSMETLKNEIKRMETTHRQLLQRYAILKTTLDEAFKRWHEGFIAGGGVLSNNTSAGNAKFHEDKTRQQVTDILQPMVPRNHATGNVSHGEHTLTLKSSGHGHKLRRETSIKSRNLNNNNHQTPQQALDKLLVMLENGANVKIILETLLDHAILSSGPAGSNGSGAGGGGGLITSAFGTAGSNGPYLDPYDAVTFEMTLNNTTTGNSQQSYAHRHSVVNAGLTPQQTGARTFTYDSAPGEDIFVTQQSQSNSNNSGAGGGLVSFAEEFKSPWHHFEGLGYGDDSQTPSAFQHLLPHPGLHHPYTYNHLPHNGNNQPQQPQQYLPMYLRFHGKIQNLFFAKIEVLRILQEIWQAKQQYDAYMAQFGSDYETAVAQAITFTANALTNANNNNANSNNQGQHKRSSSQASFDFSNLLGGNSQSGANSRVGTAGGVQESAMGVTVLPNLNPTSNSTMNSPTALSARRTIVASTNNNTTPTNNNNAVANVNSSTTSATATVPVNPGAVGGQSSANGSRSSTAVPAVRVGSANQYPYPSTTSNNPAAMLAVTPLPFYALLPRYLTMTTFLYHYFHHRYPHPAIVIEMGYNVHDCVTRRYAHVSDCRLFAAVLDERLPMDAWDDQRDMLERIRDEVHKEIKMLQSTSNVAVLAANAANAMLHYTPATASNHHPNANAGVVNVNAVTATLNNLALNGNKANAGSLVGGAGAVIGTGTSANPSTNPANVVLEAHARITAENLLRVVKRCLPTKPELSFAKLAKALAMDQQSSRFIDPDTLLYDDLQGGAINHHQVQRSHFLEQLKLQHVNELLSFHKHVFDAIAQFHDVDEVSMTVGKLREALVFADPQKPRAEVNKLLARACGGTVEEMLLQEARRVALPLEEIKRRLRQTLLTKSPPSHTKHK